VPDEIAYVFRDQAFSAEVNMIYFCEYLYGLRVKSLHAMTHLVLKDGQLITILS
jgi:hypothetical protein